MTAHYKVIYDYARQLTGSKRQAKIIAHLVILEAAERVEGKADMSMIPGFIVTRARALCHDYTRRKDVRMKPYKRIRCALNYFGDLSHYRGTEKLTVWQWIYDNRFSWKTAWQLAKVIHP
jgi:DNA-directed RNA polymerase specialized sigma24 family protein